MKSALKAIAAGAFVVALAAPVLAQDAVDPATTSCVGVVELDDAAITALAEAVKAASPDDAALAAITGDDLVTLVKDGCANNPDLMVSDAVHAAIQDTM